MWHHQSKTIFFPLPEASTHTSLTRLFSYIVLCVSLSLTTQGVARGKKSICTMKHEFLSWGGGGHPCLALKELYEYGFRSCVLCCNVYTKSHCPVTSWQVKTVLGGFFHITLICTMCNWCYTSVKININKQFLNLSFHTYFRKGSPNCQGRLWKG